MFIAFLVICWFGTRSLIYTTGQSSVHRDSCVCIGSHMYASRFVYILSRSIYIDQDSYLCIKVCLNASRFVYIHQDSYLYIKICIYTSRLVSLNINQELYVYSKISIRVALVGSRPSSCQGGSHLLLGPFPEAFVFCQSVELHQH